MLNEQIKFTNYRLLGKKVALGLVVGRNFDFLKKELEDIKDRVGTFLP